MKTILQGIVGSRAYGLATPDSDIDTLGCFVYPTEEILGIIKPQETISRSGSANKEEFPDQTLHEVEKLLRLALACNPTILELLWLDSYEVCTTEGRILLNVRQACLSRRASKTYAGYAFQQIQRLQSRGDSFSADLRKRTAKHARHIVRLTLQGKHLAETGQLQVRLNEEQAAHCREMGEMAAEHPEDFVRMMLPQVEEVRDMESVLPSAPDDMAVNEALLAIRRLN